MFGFGKKEVILYAPVKGKVIDLKDVPDPIFAEKMMGEGIAFKFEGNDIYSPVNGEIIMIADTKHALGIKAGKNVEIMIHVGLETVNLNGKGFKCYVKAGDKVKKGERIMSVDQDFMASNNINLITPMIVTSRDNKVVILKEDGDVSPNDEVIKISW